MFYIPTYVIFALLACVGLGTFIAGANYILCRITSKQYAISTSLDIIFALLVFAFAVWPIFQPQQEAFAAGEVPFSFDEYPVYDENVHLIANALVNDLPLDAIVFTDWDMMWPYYHMAYLENGRYDLTFIETFPADDEYGVTDSLVDYVVANVDEHPIFFAERIFDLERTGNLSLSPVRIGATRLFKVSKN